jgi:hypothetical protein
MRLNEAASLWNSQVQVVQNKDCFRRVLRVFYMQVEGDLCAYMQVKMEMNCLLDSIRFTTLKYQKPALLLRLFLPSKITPEETKINPFHA